MNFRNIKKASDYKVSDWIKKEFNLTVYQNEKLIENESVRWAPFEFYQKREIHSNIWIRLSVILIPFVWIILFLGLPITFICKGHFGYDEKYFGWILRWLDIFKI